MQGKAERTEIDQIIPKALDAQLVLEVVTVVSWSCGVDIQKQCVEGEREDRCLGNIYVPQGGQLACDLRSNRRVGDL